MNGRQLKIIDMLKDADKLYVQDVSQALDVSVVTIRKDFQELENLGLLHRMHGYAVRSSPDDINSRMLFDYETKLKIARRAAELVAPGETLMIESGSTSALLSRELLESKKDATIITNSVFIARYGRSIPGAKIILLGGDFQNDAEVTVGPLTELCAREFYVDKIFVGVDGYTEEFGFTTMSHTRANTVRVMSKSADKIIILTDSSKFGKRSVAFQFMGEEVYAVVTDAGISDEMNSSLQKQGVDVITV